MASTPDFKPIADYGLLSDCNTSALSARDGSIDWLCMPRFDSPALFARILDPGAGHWSITPIAPARTTRSYRDGTLVLETVFTTDTGTVVVTEAMAFADGQRGHDIGHDAPHELLRLVSGVAGEVELVFEMKPRPEYGLVKPLIRLTDYGARTFAGPSQIAVSSSIPLELEQATLTARFTVKAGERRGFALRWTEVERPAIEPTSGERVESRVLASIETWRSWEREHDIYDGPNRERVRFSARVLKGLTYHPTGAIVAAASCSLPESVGHERNWDYRYAWMRDASLTMQALYIGTCPEEASDFVSFMTGAAGGGAREDNSLQIMYGVGGEHDLSERELPHLRGWRDSAPVRVGNGAWTQTQLDVYGEFIVTLHLYEQQLGELHPEIQQFIAELADAAASRWTEPDQGIWEIRGAPRHHVCSKVFCWAALDRATKLAPRLGEHAAGAVRWAVERDRIRAAVMERGWSASGSCRAWRRRARSSASAIFERMVGYGNDLGLMAEEIDPRTGEMLGNFPQAFSHIGLINAAYDIDSAIAARRAVALA